MSSSDWNILSKIYPMLKDENVIDCKSTDPVVIFKYPNELEKIIDFTVDSENPLNESEIQDLCKKVIHYSVKTGHPNFHNQLFAGTDPYGLAGSWITEALNSSQYTYEVGPVFTLIEDSIIKKVLDLIGFKNGDGIFTPGGSISNMYSMVMARYKFYPEAKTKGMWILPELVAYTSDDSHYSIKKSVHWLGFGTENMISIKTNENGQMICDEFENEIKKSIKLNKKPFYVNATSGTTVLGAFDNLNEISEICKKYNIWMHVDACLGGTSLLSKTHRHLVSGIEKADSVSWNPHKTLGAPLQCSIFVAKEKGLLHKCNSANAQYLFQQDKFYDVNYDTGDKSVQCGRKIDAFKLWLMFKSRGLNQLEYLVDNAMNCSKYFIERVKCTPGFRLVLDDFQYTNVCFWFIPKRLRNQVEDDKWWKEIYVIPRIVKKKMIENGKIMIGYTPLTHKGHGNFFRMVVTCFPLGTKKSMDDILSEIESLGEDL